MLPTKKSKNRLRISSISKLLDVIGSPPDAITNATPMNMSNVKTAS